jgi:hypothetical protein
VSLQVSKNRRLPRLYHFPSNASLFLVLTVNRLYRWHRALRRTRVARVSVRPTRMEALRKRTFVRRTPRSAVYAGSRVAKRYCISILNSNTFVQS